MNLFAKKSYVCEKIGKDFERCLTLKDVVCNEYLNKSPEIANE